MNAVMMSIVLVVSTLCVTVVSATEESFIPLGAPSPDWYTPNLHEQVLESGRHGAAINIQTREQYAGPLAVRPGAVMVFPSLCTMGYITGAPGSYAITGAGHCSHAGQDVVILLSPSLIAAIGKTSAHADDGVGSDWSITPIGRAWQDNVDTDVPVIQGPQGGAFEGDVVTLRPLALKHIGLTGPKSGIALTTTDSGFFFEGAASPGDSGSPVLVAADREFPLGQAMGVVTHLRALQGTTILAGTRATAIPGSVADGDTLPT